LQTIELTLDQYQFEIDNFQVTDQAKTKAIADNLRISLGPDSVIYKSFVPIDISLLDGYWRQRLDNAIQLIFADKNLILTSCLYLNFNEELNKFQIKESRNKFKYSILGSLVSMQGSPYFDHTILEKLL